MPLSILCPILPNALSIGFPHFDPGYHQDAGTRQAAGQTHPQKTMLKIRISDSHLTVTAVQNAAGILQNRPQQK